MNDHMDWTNVQYGPWPDALEDLVKECKYRPGWTVDLRRVERDETCSGLTLDIITSTIDTYHPQRSIQVHHYFPVPAASYGMESWRRWLFEQFLLVEKHECMEFFQIGNERPFAPTHAPGVDPYTVFEPADDTKRKTDFRGEYVG